MFGLSDDDEDMDAEFAEGSGLPAAAADLRMSAGSGGREGRNNAKDSGRAKLANQMVGASSGGVADAAASGGSNDKSGGGASAAPQPSTASSSATFTNVPTRSVHEAHTLRIEAGPVTIWTNLASS